MRFTVIWMPFAQGRLADVWIAAPDRNAVTRACHYADELLAVDPQFLGDCSFDTVRTVVVGPLGVEFEVDDGDMQVRVLSVWDAKKGRPDPAAN